MLKYSTHPNYLLTSLFYMGSKANMPVAREFLLNQWMIAATCGFQHP
jgi:hypothetical protein